VCVTDASFVYPRTTEVCRSEAHKGQVSLAIAAEVVYHPYGIACAGLCE
jgi:hypothetical protein